MSKPDIFVDYEYGDLKEVIIGVPLMIYPDLEVADWAKEAFKILPETEKTTFRERSGKSSIDIGKFDRAEKECQNLIAIFKKYGIKVWRPEVLSRERLNLLLGEDVIRYTGVLFTFARDQMLVVGDNLIELNLCSINRIADIFAYRKLFIQRVMGSNAKWYAMPRPDYSTLIEGGHYNKNKFPGLEGGDILVLGKKILVGTSENTVMGSNELGYNWLKSILEPQGFDVERVPIGAEFLHLDVTLSTPKPGLAVICPEAFINGIPSYFDDWKLIEVSKAEAQLLATNGMPIDTKHYILPYNENYNGLRVQKELEAEGIFVERISYGNHTEDGGAIRCTTHPLVRKLSR